MSISKADIRTVKPASMPVESSVFWLLVIIFLHFPLAYLMRVSPYVGTFHAAFTLLLGLWFIILDKQPFRLIYLTGYMVGAEILWRMTKIDLIWEYDKYAVSLLLILAMMKWRKSIKFIPLIYGFLLLPSAVLTVLNSSSIFQARSDISFNLSGPFALTCAALFFSGREFDRRQLRQLLLYTIIPIVAVAFLALVYINVKGVTSEDFTSVESSSLTSGGYGPNQVSAILGLGALLCWLIIITQEKASKMTWVFFVLLIWLLSQALITLSRGGVVNFFIAASVSTPFLLKNRGKILNILLFGGVILVIFAFFIFPRINEFTGGALTERYHETDTTGRWHLIMGDMKLFQENFLLGAGPGRSVYLRGQKASFSNIMGSQHVGLPAHTEYSRMLAEHGTLGLLALLVLFVMFLTAFSHAKTPWAKGMTLAFMLWSLSEMCHAAMRLEAISYFYALPFARFKDED